MSLSDLPPFARARFAGDLVVDFGDAAAELRATAVERVVAPLTQLTVLRFSGADAENFLQGQLTCDVAALRPGRATPGGYCTAQGRLLATFLLWREAEGYAMLLARDIAEAVQRRLQMYVLRAKVTIENAGAQWIALGLSGPQAAEALADPGFAPAASDYAFGKAEGYALLTLPRGRYIALAVTDALEALWPGLTSSFKPVGTPCWQWLDIAHGLPWITAATQDKFVPQMVNLELIGGVNFQKGCYPGQEVVARTQYRARTHRRMHRAHVDAEAQAGMELYAASLGDQVCGAVVNAAPAPEGGCELLAVLHPEALNGTIHLASPDGAVLSLRELPYTIE